MTISPEINALIIRIRDDAAHGASELARQAVKVLQTQAEISGDKDPAGFWLDIRETAGILISVRPSMAPLANTVKRLLDELSSVSTGNTASQSNLLKTRGDELIRVSEQATAVIAARTADLLTDGDTVLTHSYSSTVSAAIIAACSKHSIQVIVTRSGAGRTGIRTADELTNARVPVTFIDDTAAGIFVRKCSKVLVGADRVCRDGSLVNGVGTFLVAAAAEKAAVPLFVLCDTLKFDSSVSGLDVEMEEKDAAEVISPGILDPSVTVKNPYFDITPLELITAFVTEKGLIYARDLKAYFSSGLR